MSKINDGGPAFPQSDLSAYGMGPSETQNCGMTLRDWFAGQALAGLTSYADDPLRLQGDETVEEARQRFWRGLANVSYVIADAMLAAREAKP
jgi:hypothetical protein